MKDVTLSRSAWHVKFFTWATGSAPKWNNLCPYFWSLVSLLIISPLLLLWKIVKAIFNGIVYVVKYIYNLFPKKAKTEKEYVYKERSPESAKRLKIVGSIFEWIGKGFITLYLGAILVVICMGLYSLFVKHGVLVSLTYILAVVGAIAILLLLIWGIISYFESDTHTMIVSMIKAKKNKYCPHVTWKE